MKHAFVAVPYRAHPAGIDEAWEAACAAGTAFRKARIPVYNPIAMGHCVARRGGLDPHEDVWEELNRPFLLSAAAVVVVKIPGWDRSSGIATERALAEEHKIPVYEALPGEVPLALVRQFMRAEPEDDTSLQIGDLRGPSQPVLARSRAVPFEAAKRRKDYPMARGLLDYFPAALAAVAECSAVANEQHNPGEGLHWAREKSTDHADCLVRHLLDRGHRDKDGVRHAAKAAWRALAMLQIEIEGDT